MIGDELLFASLELPSIRQLRDVRTRNEKSLRALNHGAVGRSCFPCPRIIDPGVAADYSSRPMRPPESGVIGNM